jgi:AmmeMemoRadiSam system protein B
MSEKIPVCFIDWSSYPMNEISELRPSPIAGLWYSENADRLSKQVEAHLQEARLPELDGEVLAVIAPHAGHRYSGQTAGYAFKSVLGQKRDLVAVISPYHDFSPAPLLTSAHRGYHTPLGPVWIDQPALASLKERLLEEHNLKITPVAHDHEHSLEIELPFLQRALSGDFQILPLMLHTREAHLAQKLGRALAFTLKDRNALLVASTDLSHFYPEPVANALDRNMLNQIADFSPEGVLATDQEGKGHACGAAAVAAVLWAAAELGANHVEILHHSTSGSVTGDHESVVGYGAAAVMKRI